MAEVLRAKWLWAAIAIVSMWMAVLFLGIFAGNIVVDDSGSHTSVPVTVAVAFFAVFGTLIVARQGFRGGDTGTEELLAEIHAERDRRRALEGELEQLKDDIAELRKGDREEPDAQATLSGTQPR